MLMQVSIFIPFYNEDEGVENLKKQLTPVLQKLISLNFDYEVILLDDGSTDSTWSRLNNLFGEEKWVLLLKHHTNKGLGDGMKKAIARAKGDFFAALDSDCTYSPSILIPMLRQLLKEKASVITASPYHPKGRVVGLPLYRLIPSFTASWIYRFFSKEKIHTFTSMVRIYKTDDLKKLNFESEGFLVFAEILLKLLLQGKIVVEYPTTLSVRKFNKSKMRLFKVTLDHLGLMYKLATRRLV